MSHHIATRNPMSEARRQHIYGPLQREPEPSCVAMPLVLVGLLLALVWVAGVSFGA